MYRTIFLALARNEAVKKLFVRSPVAGRTQKRFIAGVSWDDARPVVASLIDRGMRTGLDFLVKDARNMKQAAQARAAYLELLAQIGRTDWADKIDLSVRLSGLGLCLRDGEELATGHARAIAAAAKAVGATITVEPGNPTTAARTLRVVEALRDQDPGVGVAIAANLRRSENDCRAVCSPLSRVRLVKGSPAVPVQATFPDPHDVDLNYVRCLKILMDGTGVPVVGTHDPVMIEIAQEVAAHSNRGLTDFEFNLLYGIRPIQQERLAELGHVVRVTVPFGPNWYANPLRRTRSTQPLRMAGGVPHQLGWTMTMPAACFNSRICCLTSSGNRLSSAISACGTTGSKFSAYKS